MMSYKGIRLSDEEQNRYYEAEKKLKAIDSARILMKNFAFQGPEDEIVRLLNYVETKYGTRLSLTKVEEDFAITFTSINDYTFISDFPMLKSTGFVLELEDSENVIYAGVVFKDSGFNCITEYTRLIQYSRDISINSYKYLSKSYCWPYTQSPILDFTVCYSEFIPEELRQNSDKEKKIRFHYKFPYELRWNDRKYIFLKDGEYYQFDAEVDYEIVDGTLTSYKGSHKNIGIPSEVKIIGPLVFSGKTDLISVNLSEVSEIGANVFDGCSNLKHISFKNNLRRIGTEAFANCEKLIELVIPDTVQEIGNGAFIRCGVEKVTWPRNTKVIPSGMFRDCPRLYEVTIPPEVEEIGRRVFSRANTVIIYGQQGSVAEQYAIDNNIHFKSTDFE